MRTRVDAAFERRTLPNASRVWIFPNGSAANGYLSLGTRGRTLSFSSLPFALNGEIQGSTRRQQHRDRQPRHIPYQPPPHNTPTKNTLPPMCHFPGISGGGFVCRRLLW